MGFIKSFLVALTASQERFNEYTFMCSNRTKPEYFTRNGKMSFKIFKELMDTVSRNCVPIRLDRSNERRTKRSSRKYRTNQKRCFK